jgi:subtilisin family serine protease
VLKRIAGLGAFALSLSAISPAVAQTQLESSNIDAHLHDYIEQVETKRIPFIVDRQGKNWFLQNTSAELRQVGNLPIWGVNPGRTNAAIAVDSLDDNSIFINHTYAIPKLPESDVSDTFNEANPVEIIGADVLHEDGYKGSGKAVAILDTGIQSSHEYFEDDDGNSRIVAQACFVSSSTDPWARCKDDGDEFPDTDFSSESADISHMSTYYQNYMDHGTHVAGLAAGNANINAPGGIAPEADIVAVRIFGSGGAEDYDILSALAWIAENASTYDIAAVNLSLGSGLYAPGECYSELDVYWEYWYRIVFQLLIDAGVAPLVASGNDEIQNRISSPACIEPAISVGSTNAYDTSNNSYETISYFTNISTQLDLLAPGHNVMSALPGDSYGLMSGTSMATPVTAGAFTLLQSISQKPVNEWLDLLKNTGTPLDGDNVSDIPRLNIDWAACEPMDCLVPPTNLDFTTSLVEDSILSWDPSAYGLTPLNFDIEYGDNTFSVAVDVSQTNVSVTDFAEVIRIRSRNGANVSDWATLQPFRFSSTNANKIKTSSARQIVDVELAGDYCTSEVTPYIRFKYESPVTWLRKIWVDGANGFTSYTETRYIPENGELLDTDNKTKQIVINDPVSVINSSATAHVVNSPFYGPSFSLEDLFSEIEGAEYSPSSPTGLVATGGPSRAALTWDNDSSGNWKVLVDGEIVDEVSTPSALVSLTPGDHEVSICSVKTSGQNTYTSIKASTSVTALAGQFQEIEGAQVPSLNAGGQSGPVTALSTSGLNLSYSSQTSSVCEVDSTSGVVTPIAQGDCTVRISQSGNGTYAAANPLDVTFEIAGELPGKIRSLKSSILSNKVKLSWKKPTNFISSEISGYKVKWRVKLKGKSFTSWKTVSLSANKLSYTSKSYAKGSVVQFQVYAASPNGVGLISKISKLIK